MTIAFDKILDEKTTFTLDVSIKGGEFKSTRLVVKTDENMSMTFDGEFDDKTSALVFEIPNLTNVLAAGEYDAKLEVVTDNDKVHVPIEGKMNAIMPSSVKAMLYGHERAYVKEQNFEIVEDVQEDEVKEDVVEEVKEKTSDEIAAEMLDCIKDYATDLRKKDERSVYGVKSLDSDFTELEDEDEGSFIAYGSTFGNIDQANDVVHKGAFKRSINSGRKVALLWGHNKNMPIGVYKEVYEDQKGLVVKGQLNLETQQGREAHALMKQGALSMSIGYQVKRSDRDKRTGVKNLRELALHEVSLVAMPCNTACEVVGVKDFSEFINTNNDANDQDSLNHSSDPDSLHSDDSVKHSNVQEANQPTIDDKLIDLLNQTLGK